MKQKGLRKLVSMILAVVMVLSMSITGFADETYTISLASDYTAGYTYAVYQILIGDVSNETLSNVEWGSSMTDEAETALENKYSTEDTSVSGAAAVAEAIAAAENAQDVADALSTYISSMTSVGTLNDTTNFLTVAGGYYLIVNTKVPDGNYGYSDYIVKVVGDTAISPKNSGTPEFDKSVGNEETENVTFDYAIGDSVPFTLTATLASSYSAYDTYKLVFNDELSSGLTYDTGSLKVTIGETTLNTSDYALKIDGQKITVTITDLKNVETNNNLTLGAGSKIVVSYTATLGEEAESVESNTAYLEYSNNPNDVSKGGETPKDKTYVVTFNVTVDKKDGKGRALQGAQFTLYKYNEDNEAYETTGKELSVNTTDTNNDDEVDDTGTIFAIDGLAIGKYKLVETTTPAGFNTAEDIIFTITANATETESGVSVSSEINDNNNVTIDSTAITTTVVNNAGSTLPSTGGIGTTIFYIIGGILVASAAVLLVTKKRLSKME